MFLHSMTKEFSMNNSCIQKYFILTTFVCVAASGIVTASDAPAGAEGREYCAVGGSHVASTSVQGFSDDGDTDGGTNCNASLALCADDVDHDVDYDGGTEWWTFLHKAVEKDNYDECCALLDASNMGINVDVRDKRGQTSFFKAVLQGNQLIADLLLAFDANREAKDKLGRTVLYWAARDANIEMLDYLLGLKNPSVEVNVSDKSGSTPLHAAASLGRAEIVKKLLERSDININKQDNDGNTPLHAVMSWGINALRFADRYEVIKLLLSRSDINRNIKNKKGKTALEYCQEQPFICWWGGSQSECFFDFLIYKANVGNLFLGEDVFFTRANFYRVFRRFRRFRRIKILCVMQKAATHTAHARRLEKPLRIDKYIKE